MRMWCEINANTSLPIHAQTQNRESELGLSLTVATRITTLNSTTGTVTEVNNQSGEIGCWRTVESDAHRQSTKAGDLDGVTSVPSRRSSKPQARGCSC